MENHPAKNAESGRKARALSVAKRNAPQTVAVVAMWLVGYGIIVIAASSPSERRYTPRWAADAGRRWIERRSPAKRRCWG